MFTWVGNQFNTVLSTYVLGVVSSLMTAIAPIALICMTIWVTLYGWAVLRNEVSETLPVFMWKVFKIGLVLAFALQSGFYISNVSDTANALATGVATTFLPAAADPMTVTSPYALLDAFNDQASLLVLDLLKDAGIMRLDLGVRRCRHGVGQCDLSLRCAVCSHACKAVPDLCDCSWSAVHPCVWHGGRPHGSSTVGCRWSSTLWC